MNYGLSSNAERAIYDCNPQYEAEKLETKIERMMQGGEVLMEGKDPIYTPKESGVLAETDIRTDKFEVALDAVINAQKSYENRMKKAIEAGEADQFGNPIEPKE